MRLSRDQIREIVLAFNGGEPAVQIAQRFNIDRSTVAYHVEKYENSYIQGGSIYSVIKVETQHECIHPSVICTLCKKRSDLLLREERNLIKQLRSEIALLRGGGERPAV